MKKLVVSPAHAAEPDDRDRQHDRRRPLPGDGARKDHERLARGDQPDEGTGLEEGEHADDDVGPLAEDVGEVLQQLLEVDLREELLVGEIERSRGSPR